MNPSSTASVLATWRGWAGEGTGRKEGRKKLATTVRMMAKPTALAFSTPKAQNRQEQDDREPEQHGTLAEAVDDPVVETAAGGLGFGRTGRDVPRRGGPVGLCRLDVPLSAPTPGDACVGISPTG